MKIFAYGTLLDKNIQKNIIGRLVEGIPDQLAGYRKTMRQFSSGIYPDLIEDIACKVEGQILDLSANEVERCDRYEGDEYRKVKLKLKSGIEAFVYRS
jgi:gamma-glutamylcyclotransferase (GGCT)/AIG2-like uncharacterized protein YtfP